MSTASALEKKKTLPEGDCPICCEKYNNSSHLKVKCEFGDCNYETCKKCVRDYLLSTTQDPHCMMCKKQFSQAFLVDRLNSSFVMNEYKPHRKELLLDREISKLPETMPAVEKIMRIRVQEGKIAEIRKLRTELANQLLTLLQEEGNCRRTIQRIIANPEVDKVERKKFIMSCRLEGCRGFLNNHYKCEICSQHTCSKCLELIGVETNKAGHICVQGNIESAELIRKETKGCPSCGTRIFKISGCDQMWCSNCHKAWSWNTGKIDTGVVHNPHFYQFQRDNGGGTAPRNPLDVLCGGLVHIHNVRSQVLLKLDGISLSDKERKKINAGLVSRAHIEIVHRAVSHLVNVELVEFRDRMRNFVANCEKTRISYILQEISKPEMADLVMRNDIQRQKYAEILNIYELLSVVGTELFADLVLEDRDKKTVAFVQYVERKMTEYDNLRLYCNKQLAKVSVSFNQSVPQLDEKWHKSAVKFTRASLLRIYPGNEQAHSAEEGSSAEASAPVSKPRIRVEKTDKKEGMAPKEVIVLED